MGLVLVSQGLGKSVARLSDVIAVSNRARGEEQEIG